MVKPIILLILGLLVTLVGTSLCAQRLEHKSYYDHGNLQCTGFLKDSVRVGRWKFFYPSGQLCAKGKFRNGRAKGLWRYTYPDGLNRRCRWIQFQDCTLQTRIKYHEKEGPWIIQQYCFSDGQCRKFKNGKYLGWGKP